MTKPKSVESYSRQKARAIVKKFYPDLPRHRVVHHLDGNPLNNNPNNLLIVEGGDHIKWHFKNMKENGIYPQLERSFKALEKAINNYNFNI